MKVLLRHNDEAVDLMHKTVLSSEGWNFLESCEIPVVTYKIKVEDNTLTDLIIDKFNSPYGWLAKGKAKVGNSLNYLPEDAAKFWLNYFQQCYKTKLPVTVHDVKGAFRRDFTGTGRIFMIGPDKMGFVFVPNFKLMQENLLLCFALALREDIKRAKSVSDALDLMDVWIFLLELHPPGGNPQEMLKSEQSSGP